MNRKRVRPAQRPTTSGVDDLEQLSRHLTAAVDSLIRFLRRVGSPPTELEPERPLKLKKDDRQEQSAPSSWPKIIKAAGRLLQDDPRRQWRAKDLCDDLKAQGVRPKHTRGMHMAIVPRLRDAGLITENKNGTLTAKRIDSKLSKKKDAPVAKSKSEKQAAPGTAKQEVSKDAAINALVKAARSILEAEPDRSWKPIEFVREIRASGLNRDSWRGVHFYLPKILKDKGLIEIRAGGQFTASREQSSKQRTAPEEPEPAQEPSVVALASEIDTLVSRLAGMTPRERTAQVAAWAGRTRQLHDEFVQQTGKKVGVKGGPLRPIFSRLRELRQSLDCGSVDALSTDWSTDWRIYVEYQRAVSASDTPNLSIDEKKILYQDVLRSLLEVRRKDTATKDAPALIIEASTALDENDPWLVDAIKRFGNHTDLRVEESKPEEPFRRQGDAAHRIQSVNAVARKQGVPKSVLRATRGKRLLIAGGRGSHETQRLAVRSGLQFKSVDWITGDRHPNPVDLFSLAVKNKKYDIVLLMSGTDVTSTEPLVAACKSVGASLYYLTSGPSIPSVAEAIFAHAVVGGRVPEWMETR